MSVHVCTRARACERAHILRTRTHTHPLTHSLTHSLTQTHTLTHIHVPLSPSLLRHPSTRSVRCRPAVPSPCAPPAWAPPGPTSMSRSYPSVGERGRAQGPDQHFCRESAGVVRACRGVSGAAGGRAGAGEGAGERGGGRRGRGETRTPSIFPELVVGGGVDSQQESNRQARGVSRRRCCGACSPARRHAAALPAVLITRAGPPRVTEGPPTPSTWPLRLYRFASSARP